ncbi:helix-turn-helix domain-containing protein [Jeotgalibaca porci]|uniref:helix-turn-helix domain-containing protein n=1 Tax=Jeotgalibaca porci TaxID=1868793 RepID=UPI00359F4073
MVDLNKLRGKIVEKGLSQQELAISIGIDRSTFYRKMKNGGDFSIGEVSKMADVMRLTNQEAVEIFLSNKSHKRDAMKS